MSILALCPTRGRPALAAECAASFLATVQDSGSRLVFVVDADDPELPAYRAVPDTTAVSVHVVPPMGTMGKAIAAAGTDPAVLRDATSVGMVGDDNRFVTPGWDVTLDTWLTENRGIAYGDDGFQHERLPTSWWVSRPIVDVFGIVYPELRHYYMDNWWLEMGQGAGCLRYFPEVSIEHLHPLAGKAENDAIYDRGLLNGRYDRVTFQTWQNTRKRRHVEKLRGIVRAGSRAPRRVLADWHHPALWESLAILFEDRFGWQLYAPYGTEWTRHGWSIGSDAIGWTPAQYLEPAGAADMGDHLEVRDREYPDRIRRMVTYDQANAGGWDYVLGSVSAHQRPFAALARRWGARFVHQVGNARNHLDRMTPQLILASAKVSTALGPKQRIVTYHQEFSAELFGPRPPAPDPFVVTSLMLRLEATSGPYDWLAADPSITWQPLGGQNPDAETYVSPMSRVAELMAASGWIWHDKLIGDGYGHVIWTAASMGRPLIGHGSHYAGMLGAPLWQDMDTCIDLDRHSPTDTLRLIRAISGNPAWYGDLVARSQATFAELVDFDAEADAIRRLLE